MYYICFFTLIITFHRRDRFKKCIEIIEKPVKRTTKKVFRDKKKKRRLLSTSTLYETYLINIIQYKSDLPVSAFKRNNNTFAHQKRYSIAMGKSTYVRLTVKTERKIRERFNRQLTKRMWKRWPLRTTIVFFSWCSSKIPNGYKAR